LIEFAAVSGVITADDQPSVREVSDMPFCPKCRYEYEASVSKCPDCDEYLVSHLPPPREDEEEDLGEWIHVATLSSTQSSQIVVEVLQSKGIPVVARSKSGYFGFTGQMGLSAFQPAGQGYDIYIPEGYLVAGDIEAAGVLGDEWERAKVIDIEEIEE
jgi:hypothetical protein